MNHRPLLFAVVLCVVSSLAVGARAANVPRPAVDPAMVPTGILYDLVVPFAHLERFDGSASAPAADAATLRQAVFELEHASLDATRWPGVRTLRDDGRMDIRIALVDVRYDRIREEAIRSGAARVESDRLLLAPGALETKRAFLAAPVRGHTYRGARVTFVLDSFVGDNARPERVEVDFGDGAGYRSLAWNRAIEVHYPSTGEYLVRVRTEDSTRHAAFRFEVRALVAPTPNDTIPLTGVAPYEGGTATGRAFVYLAPGRTQLERPVVVFEGFDLDNTMNWDELYALLNQENLVEELRARGYDAVVLDFTESTDYIQRNAFVAVDLLRKVQAMTEPDYPLVGASMGGLVARYALAWMEANADPHRVRNFISFDVPHTGANIPLGIQYWLDFFDGLSTEAAFLLSRLDQPAARQMLLYHHTTPPGATGEADPLRATFLSDLAALGDYPSPPRMVALSNGSSAGVTQGFNAGAQVIQYQFNNIIVNIRGNVWAVPNGPLTKIFDGNIVIFFIQGGNQIVNVSGTLPWDNAPGGSRNSMQQMDDVVAPYGDIMALHPNHAFIPTVSALAIATTDPFYDVDGDPDLLSHTPFDNLYVPAGNEPHVTVTPDNAPWLLDEIDPVTTAVAPGHSAPVFSLLDAAPNPFDAQTRVRWQLARASHVRVDVFDVAGRRVTTLIEGARSAGPGEVRWSGRDGTGRVVAAGVYFVRMEAMGETQTKRVVLVR